MNPTNPTDLLLLMLSIFSAVFGVAFFIVVFFLAVWCVAEVAIRGVSAFIAWLRNRKS